MQLPFIQNLLTGFQILWGIFEFLKKKCKNKNEMMKNGDGVGSCCLGFYRKGFGVDVVANPKLDNFKLRTHELLEENK